MVAPQTSKTNASACLDHLNFSFAFSSEVIRHPVGSQIPSPAVLLSTQNRLLIFRDNFSELHTKCCRYQESCRIEKIFSSTSMLRRIESAEHHPADIWRLSDITDGVGQCQRRQVVGHFDWPVAWSRLPGMVASASLVWQVRRNFALMVELLIILIHGVLVVWEGVCVAGQVGLPLVLSLPPVVKGAILCACLPGSGYCKGITVWLFGIWVHALLSVRKFPANPNGSKAFQKPNVFISIFPPP